MKVAVEGCCHGELDNIYKHIETLEKKNGYKVDILLICGDFQAVRNHEDLQCMAVPDKYKHLQTFYKYYAGEKRAPILTVVIGGNHEASNYMWELYHGGWLAPNIYFLGHAGSVLFRGLRITGASGIFKPYSFSLGHYETLPYDKSALRSIYHIREFNVRKLSLLPSPQVFMSHDWPVGIDQYGDYKALIRRKSHFREEINNGTLGSPPLMGLLRTLKPEWWFSAHLHCRFDATVVHENHQHEQEGTSTGANPDEIAIEEDLDEDNNAAPTTQARVTNNPDEITLEDEEEAVVAAPAAQAPPSVTRFIALDKCLPKRDFLEVVDIPVDESQDASDLCFDPEWLAISRAFQPWFSLQKHSRKSFPQEYEAREMVAKELEWVKANVLKDDSGRLPVSRVQQFVRTAAPGSGSEGAQKYKQPQPISNPQTEAYCAMLQIENKINQTK
ncbi:lariat debranching enzyme [Marasmius crinis-equi]|uniref:Lariat debranching enzyme n=1 Tax=Marasmius crinis-equi TaxID=585013 RepID=A0ABR3FZY4_9AGAR